MVEKDREQWLSVGCSGIDREGDEGKFWGDGNGLCFEKDLGYIESCVCQTVLTGTLRVYALSCI